MSRRILALGKLCKTCPVCKRNDVEVGGPQDGEWVIQPHSPNPGGIIGCAGVYKRLPLTPEEKASP